MILHNLIISKISKGFISAENERYVQHVNTQRSLVENLIECNNISTLEQLEKTSCAGKWTCLSYTFTLCLECLLLTKLYNVLKITQFLCVFFPSFYVAYKSASKYISDLSQKNMFFSMTGLRCSNWSDHHIPPLKWSSPSMIKHPQSPYSFTWKELTCKGKGEITTDQTGISTWVPWISSQVLYLLSYLVPDNEPSWQSQQ